MSTRSCLAAKTSGPRRSAADALPLRPSGRVPMEFVGLARQFRSRLAEAHAFYEPAADRLMVPFRPRPGFTPMPRRPMLRALAENWRALPSSGRLRLVIRDEPGDLEIAERRVRPSVVSAPAWAADEPAVAVALRSIIVRPPFFTDDSVTMGVVGLHALARRYERGPIRDDIGVLSDLYFLARGAPAAVASGGEFMIEALDGGRWIGAVAGADCTVIARTFLDG
jgi:hypothetical protein